ncbi:hypothetical protein F4782DRAFT_522112 [Xylaria castorea]|nr:hypothetical protein F4782DRAFT_522112 [Xylaria castorea]
MTELREGLLEEEMERRKKYLLPVDKTKFGPYEGVVEFVQKQVIGKLLENKRLPFISASYFNWRIDRDLCIRFGEKDAELPPSPPIYVPPYSTTYARAYFVANPAVQEAKGKGREKETQEADRGWYLGFARGSTQVVDPADDNLGDVVGVEAWCLTGGRSRLAPLEDKVRLYEDLIGKSIPYQEGCGPFQVECPFSALGKDFEICFGGLREGLRPRESLAQLLGEASLFMGGKHGVMLLAKFRDLPEGDRRISLFLDWHGMVDTKSPAWQRVLYKAWCALLSLFHSQLRGVRMGLMDNLREYYGGSMREHLMLYSRIGAAVQHLKPEADAGQKMAEEMGGDEEEMEALLAKMDRLAKKKGSAMVTRYAKEKPNLSEKVNELVHLRDHPKDLAVFGDDLEVRLTMIRPTAEKILAEQILWVLEDPDVPLDLPRRLEQCIACLDDPESPWEKLLPIDVRYRIVSAGVWEYQEKQAGEGYEWVNLTITLLETFKERV